jgi:hypothetical protein
MADLMGFGANNGLSGVCFAALKRLIHIGGGGQDAVCPTGGNAGLTIRHAAG